MKKFKNSFLIFTYLKVAAVLLALLFGFLSTKPLKEFSENIEGKTFDLRQVITSNFRKGDDKIKIIGVDTRSYNYILENYGEWPIERRFWANLVKNLENSNPNLIVFDFLFPSKNSKGGENSDKDFIETVNANKNVVLGMLFIGSDNGNKVEMPEKFRNTVLNDKKIRTNERLVFENFQPILSEILEKNENIGFTNATREADGIQRYIPVFCFYKDYYYKTLSFLSALKYLNIETNEFELKNNFLTLKNDTKIPLNDSGRAILNWYKSDLYKTQWDETPFELISLKDVDEAIKNNDKNFLKEKFENKIVYIGATASILGDVKSTPVSKNTGGIFLHTTLLNNILDNNFIYHVPIFVDILLALFLCALVVYAVNKINSVVISSISFVLLIVSYFIFATALMYYFNLWIGIIFPLISAVIVFITTYIIKYVLKSQDYDKTYKLAVTDGMTNLYNHRYFQEEMTNNTNNFDRYDIPYSLIMIDIDFFKKFNDTYGHQSGDAVLKQVAAILKSCVRTTDIVCRYGGEEMSIILTNTKKESAIITANKICEEVRNKEITLATNDKVHVTISVGVATIGLDGKTPKSLIEYCDKCLYKAKESGRNQVVSEI